jgi:hypothetical protein
VSFFNFIAPNGKRAEQGGIEMAEELKAKFKALLSEREAIEAEVEELTARLNRMGVGVNASLVDLSVSAALYSDQALTFRNTLGLVE